MARNFTWLRWRRILLVTIAFLLLCLLNYEYPSSHISVDDDSENIQALNLKDDTHHSNTSGSFVLALEYYEQLTCATRNLLQLCNIAQNLKARVVTPFLLRSLLNGIPDFNSTRRHYYPLNTVYDVPKLNETFHTITGTHLVTFNQFIQHAPRDVVLVDTLYSYEAKTEYKTFNDSGFELFNCPNHLSPDQIDTARNAENNLQKHTVVNHFVVKKFICLPRTTHDITTDQIKQFIGIKPHTIVFNQWRGCAYHSCEVKAPRNVVNSARHRILYHSVTSQRSLTYKDISLPYNNAVVSSAKAFLDKISLAFPFVSVHVRIEKLAIVNRKINGLTKCCMNLLDNLVKSFRQKYNTNHFMTITDIGKYGTIGCTDRTCIQHVKVVESALTSMNLTQYKFDPELTHASDNPSFVSLVEMHTLAMGDRLVVVGHGSFKYQLITQFLITNAHKKVYYICTEKGNILNEFGHLDKKCSQ
ncbi:uncharacterized protein [Dysidea avara]|uniref:uncharacterized protein n=1 Tax=Dysidea avara TaxID=196820 RepID=UPI003318B55F